MLSVKALKVINIILNIILIYLCISAFKYWLALCIGAGLSAL